MKKVLVVGASGATGKLLVTDLLARGLEVMAIVRATNSLKDTFKHSVNYREVSANITDISHSELLTFLEGCDAVISCLGHRLSFKGVFGEPKRLVTDSIEKIALGIELLEPESKVKMILMNTTGNSNRDIPENPPLSQRIVISILRQLLPPHADNENAADYLRTTVGQDSSFIEWVVVRPDSLTNKSKISPYSVHPSPIRNAIFDAGATSRINVADFMTSLITDSELWDAWKGKMPVIYNDTK